MLPYDVMRRTESLLPEIQKSPAVNCWRAISVFAAKARCSNCSATCS